MFLRGHRVYGAFLPFETYAVGRLPPFLSPPSISACFPSKDLTNEPGSSSGLTIRAHQYSLKIPAINSNCLYISPENLNDLLRFSLPYSPESSVSPLSPSRSQGTRLNFPARAIAYLQI